MWDDGVCFTDGAEIARSVRALARKARWALEHPGDEAEARVLSLAIESLERRIEPESAVELSRWLENLRRRVEVLIPAGV